MINKERGPFLRAAIAYLVLVLTIGLSAQFKVHSDPIVYTLSTVGSGSLGGTAFNNASFTITATADTSQISAIASGTFQIPDISASESVAGLGTATFAGTWGFVNQAPNQGPPAAFGIVGESVVGFNADILDVKNAALMTYNLNTSIGPLSGDDVINGGLRFTTTAGDFSLNSASTVTFQATLDPVPEPSIWALFALGGTALISANRLNVRSSERRL